MKSNRFIEIIYPISFDIQSTVPDVYASRVVKLLPNF
jgi:hypothetical protein